MDIKLLRLVFYSGLAFLFVGFLFHIQHWHGGMYLVFAGKGLEFIFYVSILSEIFTSRKAKKNAIVGFGAVYSVLGFIVFILPLTLSIVGILVTGTAYLGILRKAFVSPKTVRQTFDSFKID